MKKWKTLLVGVIVGILLTLVLIVAYLYQKNKYNPAAISMQGGSETGKDASSKKTKAVLGDGVIHIDAKYFQQYGDDATGERFAIEFYTPRLGGDFYSHEIQLEDSLYVKTYKTSVYDITDRMHYSPISDLIPITVDSLTKEPIYLKNRYSKVNDEEVSEHIALEVNQNKLVRLTYLSGIQYTGICVPIHIDNDPTMVFFIFDNKNGYLMKTEEGWVGKIGDTDFTSKNFEADTVFLDEDISALNKLRKQENRPVYYQESSYTIEKQQIYDPIFRNPLLKTSMDTLYTVGDNYEQLIVGEKDNEKYLFNGFLQNITPNEFQAIQSNELFSVVSNNRVSYINDKGKLFKETASKDIDEDYRYSYEIKENNNDNSFHVICKAYDNDELIDTYETTKIRLKDTFQNVTFINNKITIDLVEEDIDKKRNYIVTQVDGLYGLYVFGSIIAELVYEDDYAEDYEEEEIEEEFVGTKFTQLLPNAYTKIHADEMTQMVLFEKDGLKGYYPLQKDAKYTELSAFRNNAFARFTLPNGTKGWLGYDGTEYLD